MLKRGHIYPTDINSVRTHIIGWKCFWDSFEQSNQQIFVEALYFSRNYFFKSHNINLNCKHRIPYADNVSLLFFIFTIMMNLTEFNILFAIHAFGV